MTLTREQTAALTRYRARWVAIRRSVEPVDRRAAEAGALLAYRAAGLQGPARFLWCDGPIELSNLSGKISRSDGANVKSALIDRVRRQVASLVRRRVHKHVRAAVASAISPVDMLVASAADAVIEPASREGPPLLQQLRGAPFWSHSLWGLFGARSFRHNAAGQHDFSWLGAYEFFHEVLGLRTETEPLRGLWQLASSVGWIVPHQHACWLAERPNILRGDAQDRLHDSSGPALRYPDGWSVHFWKGIEVPSWIIAQRDKITPEAIDSEADVQVRRCMIEIMSPERYVTEGGAVRVAEDETGILWRKTWRTFDSWAAVEVINATPEPDGRRKHFFLQVPAHMQTAREAVAWTYGLREKEYAGLVLRT